MSDFASDSDADGLHEPADVALADVLLDLSVSEVNRPMRERGDVGFVRDQDDRVAGGVQTCEQRHDFRAGLRIEVAGRLVGQQDRRIVHERAGDRDALALPSGQLVRADVSSAIGSSTFSSAARARSWRSFGRHAGIDERQLHVVERRRARQEVERLEDEADLLVADPRQLVVVHLADALAVQQVLPFVGVSRQPIRFISVDLPEPDGPMIATYSPRSISSRHAAQGVHLLGAHDIGLPEVVCFDEWHHEGSSRAINDFTTSGAPA